jgi:hypothetical protein
MAGKGLALINISWHIHSPRLNFQAEKKLFFGVTRFFEENPLRKFGEWEGLTEPATLCRSEWIQSTMDTEPRGVRAEPPSASP